jgi:hypothetical protein
VRVQFIQRSSNVVSVEQKLSRSSAEAASFACTVKVEVEAIFQALGHSVSRQRSQLLTPQAVGGSCRYFDDGGSSAA